MTVLRPGAIVSMAASSGRIRGPFASLTVLAALLGVWFIIMGIFEIIGGFRLRRVAGTQEAVPAGPTGSAVRTGS